MKNLTAFSFEELKDLLDVLDNGADLAELCAEYDRRVAQAQRIADIKYMEAE